MKIRFSYPMDASGRMGRDDQHVVEMDVVPSVGEEIYMDGKGYFIRHVLWHPFGDGDNSFVYYEPFVNIVLGR
jgi:hypothetical protein